MDRTGSSYLCFTWRLFSFSLFLVYSSCRYRVIPISDDLYRQKQLFCNNHQRIKRMKELWALLFLVLLNYGISFRMTTFNLRPATIFRMQAVKQKDITMPALSSTMKEGKIVSWNKKIGEKVQSGEVLLVVESDKADMDVEAFEDGILAAIFTPAGGTAAVGAVVASLVDNAADISKVQAPGAAAATTSAPASSSEAKPASSSSSTSSAATPPPPANIPPHQQILMPALSSTMKEGKIVSWSKKVGDKISSGDMVLVVESDKADMDVEAFEEGYLAAILVNNGEVAAVGAPVAYLAKSKESIAEVQNYAKAGAPVFGVSMETEKTSQSSSSPNAIPGAATDSVVSSSTTSTTSSSTPVVVNDGRISASGYAKSIAKEKGIDLRTVHPSRPDQYIVSTDLQNTASTASTTTSTSSAVSFASGWKSAPGVINATPTAKKLAAENNLEIQKISGTGPYGRVTPEDVLKAAGKYVPPKTTTTVSTPAVVAATKGAAAATTTTPATTAVAVPEGIVDMNGMQKAVVKNMEHSLTVPVFRVSR
jgi:pyruvate dehydrogenase E2 component (dihydrolipoamide acetyltransferase)